MAHQNQTSLEQLAKSVALTVLVEDEDRAKKIMAKTTFGPEGKPTTVILLVYNGKTKETYWGLPQAIEDYNKIQ